MLGVVIFLYLENEVKVVMYKCESWPIEKTEHQKIDAFKLVLEKTLEESSGLQGDQISQS